MEVQLLLTRNPKEDFYPERPSGEKDLSSNSKIEDSGLVGKDFYPEGVLRPRDLSRYPTGVSCPACPDLVGEDHRDETRITHPGGSSLRATDCHQRLTERSPNLTQLTALKPGHKMLATWLPIPQVYRDGRDRAHLSPCYSSFPRLFLPRRKKRRFSLSPKSRKRFVCLPIPACPAATSPIPLPGIAGFVIKTRKSARASTAAWKTPSAIWFCMELPTPARRAWRVRRAPLPKKERFPIRRARGFTRFLWPWAHRLPVNGYESCAIFWRERASQRMEYRNS